MDRILSIIIPVYQAAGSIESCVKSCLAQRDLKEDELEVILVDDGSTDGSGRLCDELAEADEFGRIKVKHTGNFGVSHARNLGIEMASGRFIAFVDADDTIAEGFADTVTKYFDEATVLVDETDSFVCGYKISGYQYIESSVLNKNTHVWGKLFCREAIEKEHIRFKEGLTIGEDLLFLIDFAMAQAKDRNIRCIPEGDYNYEENADGAMNRAFKESYLDQLVCWREAEEKLIPAKGFISEYAFVNVAASQIETALLVIGKLALLDEKDRDADLTVLAANRVTEQIKHALKVRGSFAALPFGIKLKTCVYRISPSLYLRLYGGYKRP